MSALKLFNTQVQNLIEDLITVLPNEKDLLLAKEKINIALGLDTEIILRAFLKYIYPYKKAIENRDESFFLSDKINNDVTKVADQEKISGEYALNKILGMKKIWANNLDPESKNSVWEYFKVLIVLCERYIAKKL